MNALNACLYYNGSRKDYERVTDEVDSYRTDKTFSTASATSNRSWSSDTRTGKRPNAAAQDPAATPPPSPHSPVKRSVLERRGKPHAGKKPGNRKISPAAGRRTGSGRRAKRRSGDNRSLLTDEKRRAPSRRRSQTSNGGKRRTGGMRRKRRGGRRSVRGGESRTIDGDRSRTGSCGGSKRRRWLLGLLGERLRGSRRRPIRHRRVRARRRTGCRSPSICRGALDARCMRHSLLGRQSRTVVTVDCPLCLWRVRQSTRTTPRRMWRGRRCLGAASALLIRHQKRDNQGTSA